ncbi:MAG: hypothetical protein IBX55_10420 [Methyloprofundus sp.]|nr:hypothetical protein [Methyloprofundus sp.]
MSVQIEESGVLFGDFELDDLFQIEKSTAVDSLGDGIHKVECVVHQEQNKHIVFLEAKSSYPRQADDFFQEIKAKMLHSITIWFAAVAGRYPDIKTDIGANLQKTATLKKPIHLVLVVPNMPIEHCIGATDKFRQCLNLERRLWNIKDNHIRVLNTEKAKQFGLVSPSHC